MSQTNTRPNSNPITDLRPGTLIILENLARSDPGLADLLRLYQASRSQGQTNESKPVDDDPWQAFTMADAYQVRPPIEGILNNRGNPIFELPSLNMIYGPPGSLKSFLLQDLLTCAAGGNVWLPAAPDHPGLGYTTRQSSVMWLDFDNGQRRTHDRFCALGTAHQLPPSASLTYYSMPTPWLQSTDAVAMDNLIRRIHKTGAALICVDNLGTVLGTADENSSEMTRVMSNFRRVAETTRAAIIIIHHQRKGTGFEGRAGDSVRGHSSIEAALDLVLRIERDDTQPVITIRATKNRGADIPVIRCLFTFENNSAGIMQSAVFYGLGEDDCKMDAIEARILESLKTRPENKTALARRINESTGLGLNQVRSLIDSMIAQGKISTTKGSRGAIICALP